MRIAISGTHCIGKSTLIQDFLKIHPKYLYKEEPYYQLQEMHGIEFSDYPTLDDFIEQLGYSLEQLEAHATQPNIIFERCPIDFVAYGMDVAHQEGIDFEDTPIAEKFPEIKESLENLDLIIFLPMTKTHPIACPESEDPRFQKAVDANLKHIYREELFDLLPSHEHPQLIEIWGSPEERIRKIEYYMEETNG